jgi:ABC-2 type transport system permease protein
MMRMKIMTGSWNAFLRYAGLYGCLVRNSVARDMQFKVNFLLWILVELMWFALQLGFMSVIYSHTDAVAGWTRWQVVLLVGCSYFIQQLFTLFFLSNMTEFSEHVRTGRMDFLLLLPVNPRFLVSVRKVDLGAVVNGLTALAVIGYALRQLQHVPRAWEVLGFVLCCGAGLVIHYSITFLLACSAFWTVRSQGVVWGYYNLFNLARLPEGVFPQGLFRRVFTWVVPVLLVANVPSKTLLGLLDSWQPLAALGGMSAACWIVSEQVWRWSLRHYTSASS